MNDDVRPAEDVLSEAAAVIDEQLADDAVREDEGELIDLDTARFFVYGKVGLIELANDDGAVGTYATLKLTSCGLEEILDEDKWTSYLTID